MSKSFMPINDETGHVVVVGEKAALTKRAELPSGLQSNFDIILLSWSAGPGYVQLGGAAADASVHNKSIYLASEAGIMTLRRGSYHTHIAWDGVDIHAVMGDGL